MRAVRCRRGLTLIEVLIALTVLSLALLALIPLFSLSVKTNSSSSQLASANTLAREKLERLVEFPSTDPRLQIPNQQSMAAGTAANCAGIAGCVVTAVCGNDLPSFFQPATGLTSPPSTLVASNGLIYPYPYTRTYTIQAFTFAALATGTPVPSNVVNENVYYNPVPTPSASPAPTPSPTAAPYYNLKLVTVTVQPSGGPFPGLRATRQSAYVKFRTPQ